MSQVVANIFAGIGVAGIVGATAVLWRIDTRLAVVTAWIKAAEKRIERLEEKERGT